MMINRSQIKFHETFQPETVYLAKICELASNDFSGDKYAISELTGIPTGKQKGKVEPHIKYASYMGLIDSKVEKGVYSLTLTPLGNEVFNQDHYLHENLTRWLCHYGISRPELGAPQWIYLVRYGHSGYNQINSSGFHLNKANNLFGINVDLEEMFGVVRRSYVDGFFSDLNYLRWDDGIEYIEHTERPELLFVYAYTILDLWELLFPEKKEITLIELIEKIGIGKVFNVGEAETESILDDLSFEGLFKINRQLYPATIIKLANSNSVISKLYSLLV